MCQLLTEVINGEVVNEMVYDNYGNILQKNGIRYTYSEGWNGRLAFYDGEQITYDAQGNPLNYLGHTLTWEKGRQLKSFDGIHFTYNANGIRTSKTVDGVRHDYLLDGVNILRETWDDNVLETLYDNEDSVCGIIYNGVPYYFHKNLQGDIIAIADQDGKVVARYTYDAWGKCQISVKSTNAAIAEINPYRYRGYYFDTETGLYYLQSRYYDSIFGRFVNKDDAMIVCVGEKVLDFNLFCYCENDSVVGYDPFGFYSRNKAVSYAKKWYNKRNEQFYSYSQDCANFVSQCLHAGGIKMTDSWHSYRSFNLLKYFCDPRSAISYKFWYDWDVSASWRLAKKQYEHFKNKSNNYINGDIIKITGTSSIKRFTIKGCVRKGDLLYFAGAKGDNVHHATIVVKVSGGKIYYAAHTKPRKEQDLATSMGSEQVIVIRIKNSAV